MAYPILSKDPEVPKTKTKGDESKEFKYKTEKQDCENLIKSLKNDNEYHRRKYDSRFKKRR